MAIIIINIIVIMIQTVMFAMLSELFAWNTNSVSHSCNLTSDAESSVHQMFSNVSPQDGSIGGHDVL